MLFKDYLSKYKIDYKAELQTAEISSIKAGGSAEYALYPKKQDELILLIKLCQAFSVPYKIIGGCTNTFVCDYGYRGAMIFTKNLSKTDCSGETVTAEAGTSLSVLLRKACSSDLELRSELFGIPGSIGGAIRNNAGAFGAEISDVFVSGSFYDIDNDKVLNLSKNELCFAYRYSILQNQNLVFINGIFKTRPRASEKISADFSKFSGKRRDSQPNDPSLGSFFKRSAEIIPAHLINSAGLKGKRIGGAEVSIKHAGFIINKGGATATDIDLLAKAIEAEVFEKYNVNLTREAELIE